MFKLEKIVVLQELKRDGLSISAISRRTGMDRKTVRKLPDRGLAAPAQSPRDPRARLLEPYEGYLADMIGICPDLSGRWLFREIKDCQFQSHFRALKARKSHKQAVFATAHKLLRAVHSVLKNRKPYMDPGTDYQEIMARRNAPRWIRMMKAYGIEPPAAGQAATQPA